MYHYLKKRQIEAVLRSGNHFNHGCFLQYFLGCPRVYSFHLNNLGNEVGNEFWICYVIKKCYLNLSIHISRD